MALKVDAVDLVAYSDSVTAELTMKEDSLSFYAENAGTTTLIDEYYDDAASGSTHIVWSAGTYANTAGSHQQIMISAGNGVWGSWVGVGVGTIFVSIDLKADSIDHVVLAVNSGSNWSGVAETLVANLSNTQWRTVSWQFEAPDTANFNFHIGVLPPSSIYTQGAGTILLKAVRFHKNTATSTISAELTCQEDVKCDRSVYATAFVSSSDVSLKDNVQDVHLADAMRVLDSVNAKIYNRVDLGGATRLGFLANDVLAAIPEEYSNLVGRKYGSALPTLTLDYSRMNCILWTAVQGLHARILALEAV
jgi:hypothetical protein